MEYKQREVSYTEVNTEPGCLSYNWRLSHSWLAHSSSPSSTGCSLLHWRGVSSESCVIESLMHFYWFIGIQNQSKRENEAITSWCYVLHLESMTQPYQSSQQWSNLYHYAIIITSTFSCSFSWGRSRRGWRCNAPCCLNCRVHHWVYIRSLCREYYISRW